MAEDTPHPLGLILRELDDIKMMIRDVAIQSREHADLDNERFEKVQGILDSWKGAATVAMIFIPAIVSVVVGLLVKYF